MPSPSKAVGTATDEAAGGWASGTIGIVRAMVSDLVVNHFEAGLDRVGTAHHVKQGGWL